MNFLNLEDEQVKTKKYDPLPDFHLQNPLYSITDKLNKFRSRKRLPIRVYKSFSGLKEISPHFQEGDPIQLRFLLSQHINVTEVLGPENMISNMRWRLRLDRTLNNFIKTEDIENAWKDAEARFPIRAWSRMRAVQDMLSCLNALSSRRPVGTGWTDHSARIKKKTHGGLQIYVTQSLLGIQIEKDPTMMLFDGEWLRCVSDVFTERYLLLLGSIVGRSLAPDHYPEISLLTAIFDWGDAVLREFGNRGFKLLKAYEALVIGELQRRSSGDFLDNERFLKNTVTDITAEDLTMGRFAIALIKTLQSVESPHHLTQVYGLHRIWGHPIVNPADGMLKMLKIGQKDIVKSTSLPIELGAHFKRMFCKSYRGKQGCYPKVEPGLSLSDLMESNADWDRLDTPDMELEWRELRFKQTFEIPESFNLSMIVADKSVSPTLSELKTNVLCRGTVMNQELRRGVLRWVNHESLDPKIFLRDVAEGRFPHDHKIIGLRSKEREMNPTPRMFALMSHLMRVYVVVTESMLSEHVLPHFPQITMTDDLLSLTKKTYVTVRGQSNHRERFKGRASKTICMSLDFEKWNGHMRQESTLHVFKALGELFGLPDLYHVTYDIFKTSYFYLADGSYVPSFNEEGDFSPDPPYSFTGHKGGQEGLRQKGWTIFTVVGLDYICSRHRCAYKIMGMGDNQVLQITLYTNKIDAKGEATPQGIDEMKRTLKRIFSDLIETFNSLGLPLKPLETWMSEDLFLYGKYPVWKGVPLTMDLKKIMRIFPFSNQEIMTTENILNTIAGNAQAATQMAPFIGVSYVIGLSQLLLGASDLLTYHPLLGQGLLASCDGDKSWSIKIGQMKPIEVTGHKWVPNRDLLSQLLTLVPRILGGYVSFNLWGLIMRGFPDPVSSAYSILFSYGVLTPEGDNLLEVLRRWVTPVYMPDRSLKMLLEDVASVNLLAPTTSAAGLRREVENYLKDGRVIKNSEFRDLMGVLDTESEDMIAELLCEGPVLHIRLLHDILESTIFGYVKSIISKVTKSSTILSLAVDRSRKDPLSKVIDDEVNYFHFFLWRCGVEGEKINTQCPTTLAKTVRLKGWSKQLVGVTVAHPFSYLERADCYHLGKPCDCLDGYISTFTSDTSISPHDWNSSIGGNPPYLGSMTKEKLVIATSSKIYSGEPLIRRPINLMRVIGWFVPDESNTAAVIKSCVNAVSDINPNEFKGISEGSSGSEIHRYKDTSLKHGALCSSNYLYSTRYHVSTDTFTRYAKGAQNYDIMFQANLCAIVESTHLEIVHHNISGGIIPKVFHHRQFCYECVSPLDEEFHDIPSRTAERFTPSRKNNRYLYVPTEKVSISMYLPAFPSWVDATLSEDDARRIPQRDRLMWLTESVVDNILIDLSTNNAELTHMTSSLLDVKEHNRLFYLTVSPKGVFDNLCHKIRLLAEWRCLNVSDWRAPTDEGIQRASIAIVSGADDLRFSGMAGFFSWPEQMRKYYCYPEILEPDELPTSTLAACRSIKGSLINLLSSGRTFYKGREINLLLEETKQAKLVLKMMVYELLRKTTKRWCCLRAIASLSPHELAMLTPELIVCKSGHHLFPRGFHGQILRTNFTMDSLKKSISDDQVKDAVIYPQKKLILRPLAYNSCYNLLDSRQIKSRLTGHDTSPRDDTLEVVPIAGVDLLKLASLPTNADYKYMEIVSELSVELRKGKHIWVLGNGLGGSSRILEGMIGIPMTVSTLLDTGNCIPQSYPSTYGVYSFGQSALIDSKSMINAVNDVFHPAWAIDWANRLPTAVDTVISDIELIGPDDNERRGAMIERILKFKPWALCVVKDYIYSKSELSGRLGLLNRLSSKYRLITCNSRQRVVPECWWVILALRKDPLQRNAFYYPDVLTQLWEAYKEGMNHKDELIAEIIQDINLQIMTKERQAAMLGRVRTWSTLPIIGSTLPHRGTYTRLLGYLQRGKKPADVHAVTESGGRKLYMSDYNRLREVLFGMAVSMIGDIQSREDLLNDSEHWVVDWHPWDSDNWVPFLKRIPARGPAIHVYDYVPYLSVMMYKDHLIFKRYEGTVKFAHNKDRDILCFPLTKASSIKYLGSATSAGQKSKIKRKKKYTGKRKK